MVLGLMPTRSLSNARQTTPLSSGSMRNLKERNTKVMVAARKLTLPITGWWIYSAGGFTQGLRVS